MPDIWFERFRIWNFTSDLKLKDPGSGWFKTSQIRNFTSRIYDLKLKDPGSGRFKTSRIRNFTSRIYYLKDPGSGQFKTFRIRNFTSRFYYLKDPGSGIFQSLFAMKNLVKLKLVNSTKLLTVRYGMLRYCTILYDTVPYRHEYICQIWRCRTFFLYSARVFFSNMTVPYLFSLFGTCILVITAGTVPFFFIRHMYSCQIWRYRTFFLYSARVFLS